MHPDSAGATYPSPCLSSKGEAHPPCSRRRLPPLAARRVRGLLRQARAQRKWQIRGRVFHETTDANSSQGPLSFAMFSWEILPFLVRSFSRDQLCDVLCRKREV